MQNFINVDDRQLKKLSRDFKIKRPSQITAIIRATLNDQAFAAMKEAKTKTIPHFFHNRTKWIISSILVDKASGKSTKKMRAEVGAKKRWKKNPSNDFIGMRQQEKGETLRKPGIHTLNARGGAFNKRVKPSVRRNRLGKLRVIRTKKQLRQHDLAGNTSNLLIRNISGIKSGIYMMKKARSGKGGGKIRRIRMIQDLSRNSTRIPKRPWLKLAVKKAVTKESTSGFYQKNYKRFTK